jgi:hypothetical protein
VPSLSRREIREPRPARPAEIRPSLACGQRHQNVGQGRARAEPREQAIKTIAPRSLATRAVDADYGQGNSQFAEVLPGLWIAQGVAD